MENNAKDFQTKTVLPYYNNTRADPKGMAEADTTHLRTGAYCTDSQSPLLNRTIDKISMSKKFAPILRTNQSNSTSENDSDKYTDCISRDKFSSNPSLSSESHLTNINSDTLEKSDLKSLIKNNKSSKHWCENKTYAQESSDENCSENKRDLNYSEKHYSILHNVDFLTLNSLRQIDSVFKKFDICALSSPKSNKLPLIFLDYFDKLREKDLSKTHFENGLCLNMLNLRKERKCGIMGYEAEFKQKTIYKLSSDFSRNKYSAYVRPYRFSKHSYVTDLMKFYNKLYFPTQSRKNMFESNSSQQETALLKNASFQVFTKNRELSEGFFKVTCRQNILPRAKPNNLDKNRPASNDSFASTETRDSDEEFMDTPKNTIKGDIPERQLSVALKLAEIRQRVRKLHYKTHTEMNRRHNQHQQFIQECRRICDSAVSFSDLDVLCSAAVDNVERRADISSSSLPVIVQSADSLRIQNSESSASDSYLKMIRNILQRIPYLYVTVPVCLAFGVRFAATIIGKNILVLCYF